MHHRLLLGSTALVSAGILFANATPAQADIEVTLGGYTEFGGKAATDETLQNGASTAATPSSWTTRSISRRPATTDGGLTYGSYAEIELSSGDDPGIQANSGNAFVDEVNLFFSGGFGRIELGRQDGAEDVMLVGGEDAQSGTGGVDGDTANLVERSSTSTSATSPRRPTSRRASPASRSAPATSRTPATTAAATATAASTTAQQQRRQRRRQLGGRVRRHRPHPQRGRRVRRRRGRRTDDRQDYAVGGLLGLGGLSFGATWGQKTDFNEADWAHLGLKYAFGNASASIGYTYGDVDDFDDEQHVVVVSGDVGLAPGLKLKGDVSYNTEDPFGDQPPQRPGRHHRGRGLGSARLLVVRARSSRVRYRGRRAGLAAPSCCKRSHE